MANRAGLRKVTKTVRGKKGSVRRSYWVKTSGAVKGAAKAAGGFVARHKGKIAGAAALAGAAYLGVKHGSKIAGAVRGAHFAKKVMDSGVPSLLTGMKHKHGMMFGAAVGIDKGSDADRARVHALGAAAERAKRDVANAGRGAAQSVANAGKRVAGRVRTGARHAVGRANWLAGG